MQKIELRGDIGFEITLAEIMGIVKANADKEINFIVNTYGGYVDEAWRIYNYLATQNNISVTFDGVCASAGTFAFLSIPREKRKATADTMFAIHLPYNNYFLESMNQEQLEADSEKLNIETEKIKVVYEKEMNMSREEIDILMSPDSFFSSQSALGFELITEVIELEENEAQNTIVFDKQKTENRICAFVKKEINQKNQNKMSEKLEKELKEQRTILQTLVDKVSNLFKPKDLIIQTKEGVELEVSGEDVAVGVEVINTPDGTYTATIDDTEKTIVVKDGKIESIEDVVVEETPNELDTLKAENEALKQEIETLKSASNKVTELEKEVAELKEVKAQVEELKALKTQAQNFLKKDVPPAPQGYVERRKKQLNKK